MDKNTAPAQLSEALQPLLTELKSKWVRNFLLTPSPIHLDHLLSPSLHSTSIQLNTQIWNTMPTTKFPVGDQVDTVSNVLLRPAFITGSDIYGVGVAHTTYSNVSGWLPNTLDHGNDKVTCTCNFRFILSPSRQCFVFASQIPGDGKTHITVSTMKSLTCMNHSVYLLHQKSFSRESNRRERALSVSDVSPSLVVMHQDVVNGRCALCGAHWKTSCGCKMYRTQPLHPFDFAYFSNCIQPFINTFEPQSRTVYSVFGKFCKWKTHASRSVNKCVHDESVTNNLAAWSVSEYLKDAGPLPEIAITDVDEEELGRRHVSKGRVEAHTEKGNLCSSFSKNGITYGSLQELGGSAVQHLPKNTTHDMILNEDTPVASNRNGMEPPGAKEIPARDTQGIVIQDDATTREMDSSSKPSRYEMIRLRREKNREAARRSKEKRKMEMLTLKADLARAKQLETELRKREHELRAENTRLRIQYKQSGSTLL